ncbi:hypothetical protein [Nonomuraea dietziae]|uniref:hypothetical protein n=1 Tax=Nonomuraea dietziae TaxID=65515 RepID=UPI0031D85DC9
MNFARLMMSGALALVCLSTAPVAASASARTAPSARGTVVSATQVEKLDKKQVAERLKAGRPGPCSGHVRRGGPTGSFTPPLIRTAGRPRPASLSPFLTTANATCGSSPGCTAPRSTGVTWPR